MEFNQTLKFLEIVSFHHINHVQRKLLEVSNSFDIDLLALCLIITGTCKLAPNMLPPHRDSTWAHDNHFQNSPSSCTLQHIGRQMAPCILISYHLIQAINVQ